MMRGSPGMVAAGVVALGVALSPALRLAELNLAFVSASPRVTIEELKDAIIRVWRDEERGYFSEARFAPRSPAIYMRLTPDEAWNLTGLEPDPSLIARVFDLKEPVAA